MRRALAFLIVLGLWLSAPSRSEAAPASEVIVLLSPSQAGEAEQETLTRLAAELKAAGFSVVRAERRGSELRASLEQAVEESGAAAAIAIETTRRGAGVEVWVTDRATGKLSVRPVERLRETPATLAIRAVELLRASLLELAHPAPSQTLPAPSAAAATLTSPVEGPRHRFAVEAGVATLLAVDPVLPAVAPELRLLYTSPLGLGARLTFIGPSAGPALEGVLGEAELRQVVATVDATFQLEIAAPLSFRLGAGLGLFHVEADGVLRDRARERGGSSSALLTELGAGLALTAHRHVAIHLDVLAAAAFPRITIEMGDERVGRLGRPLLGSTLGVAAQF